jgi:hypothetical protein
MQESLALVRLPPIALIGISPTCRRSELAERRKDRRAAAGRVVSGAAVSALVSFFFLAYGAGAVLAWVNGAHIAIRIGCSIGSAFFLAVNGHLLGEVSRAFSEYRRLAVPQTMVADARAELALDEAIDEWNGQALSWNTVSAIAEANDVDERYVARLRAHREDLERRREAIMTGLDRVFPDSASCADVAPQALPPPSDWGHVVRIDLKSR